MKWILIICLILLASFLIIIITRLKVNINYFHSHKDDSLKIEFRAWLGLIRYKIDIPLIKLDENSAALIVKEKVQTGAEEKTKKKGIMKISAEDILTMMKNAKILLKHVVSLHRIIRHFFKKVNVKQLEWHTTIGAGDAALTGMLTGAVWSAKGSLVAVISHYFRLQDMPNLSVRPHFQMAVAQTSFKCMLQFRIGHAIMAGIKLVKFWKGGRPYFKKPVSALSQDKTKPV